MHSYHVNTWIYSKLWSILSSSSVSISYIWPDLCRFIKRSKNPVQPGSLSANHLNVSPYYRWLQSTFTQARSKLTVEKASFYSMHEIPHGTAGNVYNTRAPEMYLNKEALERSVIITAICENCCRHYCWNREIVFCTAFKRVAWWLNLLGYTTLVHSEKKSNVPGSVFLTFFSCF